MRITATKAFRSGVSHLPNSFDINSAAAVNEVRRDIDNGFGILFQPEYNEREDLFTLFEIIREYGIKNVSDFLLENRATILDKF